MKPVAVRALFWLIDQRSDPNLKFGDYAGPPQRVWLPHLAAWKALADELGKQIKSALGANGSDASPSDADTPPTSSTESS